MKNRKRNLLHVTRAIGLAGMLIWGYSSLAAQVPVDQDFDIRGPRPATLVSPASPLSPGQAESLEYLRQKAPGELRVQWSTLTSAPHRIHRFAGYLTDPSTADSQDIASSFLSEHLMLFRLTTDDIAETRWSRNFTTRHNGVTHVTLQQQIRGIDVFGGHFKANIDATGRIINASGELMPGLRAAVNTFSPRYSAEELVKAAAASAGVSAPSDFSSNQQIFFPISPGEVRLAWRFQFSDPSSSTMFAVIVDAVDGRVLWRKNLTSYDHFPAHGAVYSSDDPNPNTPKGTATGVVPRDDLPFNGGDFFPHDDVHFDWWDGGPRTTTTSNNVDAYADRDGNNTPDVGSRPIALATEDFTFPIDLSMAPSTYQDSAVTNLFWWNNRLHDWLYQMGFDEASGNFQEDNFGLGGSGSDSVMAEAQDNAAPPDPDDASSCNANFGTPGDGSNPRMQMFECGDRDGDLDNVVIAHEYGHGVHSRLVSTAGNQRGNEGWSDYFGLAAVAEEGDPYGGAYGVGNWLFAGNGDGIRSDPYSTDLSIYKRTYADINDASTSCQIRTCSDDPTETCSNDEDCTGNPPATCDALGGCMFHEDCEPPNTAISQGPCRSQVHRTGELWSNALWNMRMRLIYKWGYQTGDDTSNKLVIDGMKLSPADPHFLDGRDAILAADLANNGGVNQCLIWDAFAKMGMGASAVTTDVLDLNPIEAFDIPAGCSPVVQIDTTTDMGAICEGDFTTSQLRVFNTGGGDLIISSAERTSGSSDITINPSPTLPVFIGADAHVDFTVACTPSSAGTKTATITLETNSTSQPTIDIEYMCDSGVADINAFITDSGDFGNVCTGDTNDLNLTVQNDGACDLEIDSIDFLGAADSFELPDGSLAGTIIESGNSLLVPVRYAPDMCDDTPETATVRVTSNDPDDSPLDVPISGSAPCPNLVVEGALTGLFAFPPTVVDTEGTLGCFADQSLSLRNNGECPLTIGSIGATGADFEVIAPTEFPILLPGGEETLSVTVRFLPQADANPLAPSEVTGELTITSDDPDGDGLAALCGESVAQSGVRILVVNQIGEPPVAIDEVDRIRIRSHGIQTPGPVNLSFTDHPLSSAMVCGNDIAYHVDQETLPSTFTTGNNPNSSYKATAKEGGIQTVQSFTLGQCEFRDFQLQLEDVASVMCLLLPPGASCTTDGECCSSKCRGPSGRKTCR